MSVTIQVDESIYNEARRTAKAECRTIAHQIEYWAKVGKAALDNPDLPIDFIRNLLIAREQDQSLVELFTPQERTQEQYGFLPHTDVKFVESNGKVYVDSLRKQEQKISHGKNIIAHLQGKATIKMNTEEIMRLTRR